MLEPRYLLEHVQTFLRRTKKEPLLYDFWDVLIAIFSAPCQYRSAL